jgi:membrane protein DedA with SNARE-associated domain
MSPEALLEKFGYLAVFLGTIIEGEAILLAAGFFASRDYFDRLTMTLVAFTGAYTGHIFWFWLGRGHGVKLLDRFPRLRRHLGQGIRVFERYGAGAILATQWLYGLRITCTVIIGMSRIPVVKFLAYQALSCAVWVLTITSAGYYFGHALESLIGRVAHVEIFGLGIILAIAVAFWLYHRRKERARLAGSDD